MSANNSSSSNPFSNVQPSFGSQQAQSFGFGSRRVDDGSLQIFGSAYLPDDSTGPFGSSRSNGKVNFYNITAMDRYHQQSTEELRYMFGLGQTVPAPSKSLSQQDNSFSTSPSTSSGLFSTSKRSTFPSTSATPIGDSQAYQGTTFASGAYDENKNAEETDDVVSFIPVPQIPPHFFSSLLDEDSEADVMIELQTSAAGDLETIDEEAELPVETLHGHSIFLSQSPIFAEAFKRQAEKKKANKPYTVTIPSSVCKDKESLRMVINTLHGVQNVNMNAEFVGILQYLGLHSLVIQVLIQENLLNEPLSSILLPNCLPILKFVSKPLPGIPEGTRAIIFSKVKAIISNNYSQLDQQQVDAFAAENPELMVYLAFPFVFAQTLNEAIPHETTTVNSFGEHMKNLYTSLVLKKQVPNFQLAPFQTIKLISSQTDNQDAEQLSTPSTVEIEIPICIALAKSDYIKQEVKKRRAEEAEIGAAPQQLTIDLRPLGIQHESLMSCIYYMFTSDVTSSTTPASFLPVFQAACTLQMRALYDLMSHQMKRMRASEMEHAITSFFKYKG